MALIPQGKQSQVMLLITMLMGGLGWAFWTYWEQPTGQQIEATRVEIDSLQRIVDRAKQDLASGTVEDLRRKVEEYTSLLSVMRRLVPEKNEVPALIDDISTKAKIRGVTIGRLEPLTVGGLRAPHGALVAHHRAQGRNPQAGAAAGPALPVRHAGRAARGAVRDPHVREGGGPAARAGRDRSEER